VLETIRRLHRLLVDRLADTAVLRGRAGADAAWAHYERHATAWRKAADRHAAARERAHHLARHDPRRSVSGGRTDRNRETLTTKEGRAADD
jgi:hypothetical protein